MIIWRRGWDSNPRGTFIPAGFQDRCLQPLGHPSRSFRIYRICGDCATICASAAAIRAGAAESAARASPSRSTHRATASRNKPVGANEVERLLLGNPRRFLRPACARKCGQAYVLRRRVAIDDVVRSRCALEAPRLWPRRHLQCVRSSRCPRLCRSSGPADGGPGRPYRHRCCTRCPGHRRIRSVARHTLSLEFATPPIPVQHTSEHPPIPPATRQGKRLRLIGETCAGRIPESR